MLEALLVCALVVVAYVVGAEVQRRSVARVFDRRFTCDCGRRVDRAVSLNRCACGEEWVGPPIADEIRDDYFFERENGVHDAGSDRAA